MLPLQKLGDIQKYISVQQESVSANWTQYEKSIFINYYVQPILISFIFLYLWGCLHTQFIEETGAHTPVNIPVSLKHVEINVPR